MTIRRFIRLFSVISVFDILTIATAKAVCPVCTVAVGAGLAISESLGISDAVSGTWFGAFLLSITIATIDWLAKKKWGKKPINTILSFALYYGTTLWWMFGTNKIGRINNHLDLFGLNIDKLLFGLALGSLMLIIGDKLYLFLKKKNGGKAHFPFEKVVIPFGLVLISSGIVFLLVD